MKTTTSQRDRLIEQGIPLVKMTANRLLHGLHSTVEYDDLVSAGYLGLMKAVERFDASRGVKFSTFAIALIRGDILEYLRANDWVPRSVRTAKRLYDRTEHQLRVQCGRKPTAIEMAKALSLSMEAYYHMIDSFTCLKLASLDEPVVQGAEKLRLMDVLLDPDARASVEADRHDRERLLQSAIERLPERERRVMMLYYYEGQTFKVIGVEMKISESRVYQLHTQALHRLRGFLCRDMEGLV